MGLGGGCLLGFLHEYLPLPAALYGIDNSIDTLRFAADYFTMSGKIPGTLNVADAMDGLRSFPKNSMDCIIIDVDAQAAPAAKAKYRKGKDIQLAPNPAILSEEFFVRVHWVLGAKGMVVINSLTEASSAGPWKDKVPCVPPSIWLQKINLYECLAVLFQSVFVLSAPDMKNRLIVASNEVAKPLSAPLLETLRSRLRSWSAEVAVGETSTSPEVGPSKRQRVGATFDLKATPGKDKGRQWHGVISAMELAQSIHLQQFDAETQQFYLL